MNLTEVLSAAVERGASDILIITGLPVSYKIGEHISPVNDEKLLPADTERLVKELYDYDNRDFYSNVVANGEDDFSVSLPQLSRFRVNAFKQRGSYSAVIRVVRFDLPDRRKIGIPDTVMEFAQRKKGLVLVTGPAGSGKSTTLACLIDSINSSRNTHIITIEDPIEFLHRHNKSVVTQRELNVDTKSYDAALRAALRQAPDVILLGEMRDYDTIRAAITAAETGHLVISTLHTIGAANTIDRIIDAFPPTQQQQIRLQLSMVLQGVVSQQLVPLIGGGIAPAFEILVVNNAVRNMIRESKAHQIESVIYAGRDEGMVTMDNWLFDMYSKKRITADDCMLFCVNSDQMAKRLGI